MAFLPQNVLPPAGSLGHYIAWDADGRAWYAARFGTKWKAWPGVNHPARGTGLEFTATTLRDVASAVKAYRPVAAWDGDSFTSV
jgi:hypothetical protein